MSQDIRQRRALILLGKFSTTHHNSPHKNTFSKCLKEYNLEGYKFSRYRLRISDTSQRNIESRFGVHQGFLIESNHPYNDPVPQ